jgi:hypothetical protein
MALIINTSPEQEARLEERARRCGVDVQQYVLQLIEREEPKTAAEVEAAFLATLGTPEEEEESERLWQEKFAAHPEVLQRLRDELHEDERLGLLVPLGESFDDELPL